jgi:hypothetical protein
MKYCKEEGCQQGVEALARSVGLYAKEVTEVNDLNERGNASVGRRLVRWAKPPVGFLKLNYDASFILGSNSGS